jgi:hypothetical protein
MAWLASLERDNASGIGAALSRLLYQRFRGSRSDLERVTEFRVARALCLLFFSARAVHLVQALVDTGLGHSAFAHPRLAVLLAVACVLESVLLLAFASRRWLLTSPILAGDLCFGLVALPVMAEATNASPGRTSSLNWVLPLTVTTAGMLGLSCGGPRLLDPTQPAQAAVRLRSWPVFAVAALTLVYLASMTWPRRLPDESWTALLGNAGNYSVYFLGAAGVGVGLRQRLTLIAHRNAEAVRESAELARQAHWRTVQIDVFGPVLNFLDRLAEQPTLSAAEAPADARQLLSMIESVNPRSEQIDLPAGRGE